MGTEGNQPNPGGLTQRLRSWGRQIGKKFHNTDEKLTKKIHEARTGGKPAGSGAPPVTAAELAPTPASEPVKIVITTPATAPAQPVEPAKPTPAAKPATAPEVAQVPQPAKAAWETNPARDPWYPTKFKTQLGAIKYHQYQDNYGTERRAANGWHIVGATRRGKKHAHDATYREDAFDSATTEKFTILCVADGAGSYPLSRIGSQFCTTELVHHLSAQLTRTAEKNSQLEHVQFFGYLAKQMEKSILHVINSLVKYAEKNEVSPKDFRCTLLSALFYHDDKHQVVLLNQIGDGAICTYNKKTGEVRKIGGEGESGSHSGEVSRFVPDEASKRPEFHILPDKRMKEVDGLMLCSDGIEDPFYPMEKNSAHIFRQFYNGVKENELAELGITQLRQAHIFGHPTEGASLESWMTFEKKGESDDRTLLVMFRGEG